MKQRFNFFRGRVLNPERQFCSFHISLVNESRLYDWPCENITYMHIHYSLPDSHPYSRICTCDTIVLVIILWESVIDMIWRTESRSTYFVRIWIISLSNLLWSSLTTLLRDRYYTILSKPTPESGSKYEGGWPNWQNLEAWRNIGTFFRQITTSQLTMTK